MTAAEQKKAAKKFAEYWNGKGRHSGKMPRGIVCPGRASSALRVYRRGIGTTCM